MITVTADTRMRIDDEVLEKAWRRVDHAGLKSAAGQDRDLSDADLSLLRSVARQLMTRRRVTIEGRSVPVRRTSRLYLRIADFLMNGRGYLAIEQNAAKPSYWAQLARKGHEVVQFRDLVTGRFVAVVVDGVVRQYRKMREPREARAA